MLPGCCPSLLIPYCLASSRLFPYQLFLISSVFIFSVFTGSLFRAYRYSQVFIFLKIRCMKHGAILKSLRSASALSRVLGNLVSISGLLWKTKSSIFPSDLICCDRFVGCQLQPAHLLEILSLWLYLIFLDLLLYNCSFSVFICISFSSSINIIHKYHLNVRT